MTAESVVTKEELGVAQLCAIITKGTMADDSAFHLLTLANTATGIVVVRVYTVENIHKQKCT